MAFDVRRIAIAGTRWFEVRAQETWRHADEHIPARALTLPLETTEQTELVLVVDEGDNAPLPITAVRLLLPGYRLRFYHPCRARHGWPTAETISRAAGTISRCWRRG